MRRRPTAWLQPERRCCRCGEVIRSVATGGPSENAWGGAYCPDCDYESVFPIVVRGLRDSEDDPTPARTEPPR